MNFRRTLWESCILTVLLCAGWQALSGPDAIPPGERAARRSPDRSTARSASAGKRVLSYGKLPLSFAANQGQVDQRVRFLSHGKGYGLFLTGDAAVLELQRTSVVRCPWSVARTRIAGTVSALQTAMAGGQSCASEPERTTADGAEAMGDAGPTTGHLQRTTDVVQLKLVNANENPAVLGTRELPGKANYFLGDDPGKWHTNVPTYAGVRYRDIYPGIDLVYYGNQGGELEYDFVVSPGADPGTISFDVAPPVQERNSKLENRKSAAHASPQLAADGTLVIPAGDGTVRFEKPIIYQERGAADGSQGSQASDNIGNLKSKITESPTGNRQFAIDNRQFRDGRFTLDAQNRVHFALGPYDRSRTLVIDPVLVYSTYLGGAGDQAKGVAVDSSGNAYLTGSTLSTTFPLVAPYQSTNKAKSGTVFVSKLKPGGSALVYSTYLGGSVSEQGNAIAVDSSGDAYVTGSTCSSDFPTASPIQSSLKGVCDGFVTELNPTGSGLVYSTFLGGSGATESGTDLSDAGTGIAVDSSDAAYVTGGTWSTDFPTTSPIQGYGGGEDAFLSKLSASGSAMVYSTYLGGSAQDQGNAVAVDSSGNAYVTGFTLSSDFPTASAFQASNNATTYGTAFVAKMNSAGSALVYSTYLGGSTMDSGAGIAVDSSGNAYLTGATWSSNFPTLNPLQATNRSQYGGSNAFVSKLNAAGSALVYSTYLGGSGHSSGAAPSPGGDSAYGIAIDSSGVAFVAGLSGSPDFPTLNAIQSANNSANQSTAFVACLNSAGSALAYSTYLGGTGNDQANAIAIDASDDAYVAGTTTSTNFPTQNPFQSTPGGAFAAQISTPPAVTFVPASLNFGNVTGATTSPVRIVTVTPIGNAAVDISSIIISGDFALETTATSCPYGGGTISPGLNCTINVSFTPTATGPLNGNLAITYNGVGSPLTIPLAGTGIVSAVNVFPPSLNFSGEDVGTQGTPQPVTLSNIGAVQLNIGSVAVSSGFIQNNNCLPSIAAKGSCTVNVSFEPTAVGAQTGTLTVTDYAANSPQTVALSGTGLAPGATLSPTSLTFPGQTVSTTSAPQTLTLSNTGSGALTPLMIGVSGDFGQTNNCGGSVASGSNCTINVTFTPTASGARGGTLTVTDNAANSPQTVALSGTGQDFTLSTASGSPTSVTVTPGQTAKYSLAVTGVSGFSQAVTLGCGGEPSEATCIASPSSVSPGSGFFLLVTTTAPSSLPPRSFPPPRRPPPQALPLATLLLAGSAWACLAARRAKAGWRAALLPLAAALLAALALAGCGRGGPAPNSNHGTPTGIYTLTVTGSVSSGSTVVTRSVTLTLNVS